MFGPSPELVGCGGWSLDGRSSAKRGRDCASGILSGPRKFRKTRIWNESVDVRDLAGIIYVTPCTAVLSSRHSSRRWAAYATSLPTCAAARAVHSSKSAPQSPALPARHRATRLMRIALLLMCLHPAATRQMGGSHERSSSTSTALWRSRKRRRKRFVAATGVACDSARWDAECGKKHVSGSCHLLGVDEPPQAIEDLRQRVVSDALADVAPTKAASSGGKGAARGGVPCAVVTWACARTPRRASSASGRRGRLHRGRRRRRRAAQARASRHRHERAAHALAARQRAQLGAQGHQAQPADRLGLRDRQSQLATSQARYFDEAGAARARRRAPFSRPPPRGSPPARRAARAAAWAAG